MPATARALASLVLSSQARGLALGEAILARAVDIASVDGLDGLTVGSLATQLHMSKSGLFAPLWLQEELQLATSRSHAKFSSARSRGRPSPLLGACHVFWGLINQWLILVEKRVFSGGVSSVPLRLN